VTCALLVGLACESRSIFTCALDLLSAVGEERGVKLRAAAGEVAFCHRFRDGFAAFGAGGPDLVADVWHLGGGGDGRSVRNCGGGGDGDGRRRWMLVYVGVAARVRLRGLGQVVLATITCERL
jgi:hypothetical protein